MYSSEPIQTPDDAIRLMDELLKGYDREVFCIVNFRTNMTPINMNIVSMGTLDAAILNPREILKSSVLSNAAAVMAFHNHPAGSLSPSLSDIETTDRLQKIYSLMGIQFLDHIIIGDGDRYYSFREDLALPTVEKRFATSADELYFEPIEGLVAAEQGAVVAKTEEPRARYEGNAERIKEITDQLEAGIAELFESEQYKAYLNTMSKFHNYSLNNTLLIAMQKPDATLVAGYQAWRKNHSRQVRKGEKGIRIIAPSPYKTKQERNVIDPGTGRPKVDAKGMPVKEIVEVERPGFRVATVFDISQTEGKELPSLGVSELTGSVEDYNRLQSALFAVCPVPVGFEQITTGAKGYYHLEERRIALQEGMGEAQTVKTLIHEMAHQKLHAHEQEKSPEERLSARTKEVEAESVAYTVCQHFGIDTSEYSFGYIAAWSSGKETTELKESLGKIRAAASEMITQIEEKLIMQERTPELEAVQEAASTKASVLRDLLSKKTEHSSQERGRKWPSGREEGR